MSELKACPFCGRSAEDACGDLTCSFCIHADDTGEAYVLPEVWNARFIEDSLRTRITKLEQELQSIKTHVQSLESEVRHHRTMRGWYR